jgi:hypothetical protein
VRPGLPLGLFDRGEAPSHGASADLVRLSHWILLWPRSSGWAAPLKRLVRPKPKRRVWGESGARVDFTGFYANEQKRGTSV